jgi:hypothetical protein
LTSPRNASIFVEEPDPRWYDNGTWALNSQLSDLGWVDPLAAFHGIAGSFSFADCHAENHRWREARTIKTARDAAKGISTFFAPGGGPDNPDFVWVYNHYRHAAFKPLP